MDPDDLIEIGRHLAADAGDRGRPRQARLRRAVSAAYYALFHAMARSCADMVAGATPASRSPAAWRQVYRSLEHGHAKNQCNNKTVMEKFPEGIQSFGRAFVEMQSQRHAADYDPSATYYRDEVMQLIDATQRAMTDLKNAPNPDRKAFAIYVLLKTRSD